jgi:hypothetical protein
MKTNKNIVAEEFEKDKIGITEKDKTIISGNILIFYAYDIGDVIDINKIKSKKILKVNDLETFPHFKNYHVPLSIDIMDFSPREEGVKVLAKIHNFGVLSLNYIIPFRETFDTLKIRLIEVVEDYKLISKKDGKLLYSQIKSAMVEPNFFNLKTTYYAVQVENKVFKISNKALVEKYGNVIASLLRLETQTMSEYQIEETLQSSTAYYRSDLVVISSEGAFIYDSEYNEPMEFFELAGIQKLELQYFDKLLDKKLNHFYSSDTYKLPMTSYIPLLGSRIDSMLMDIAKLRVDISVITERLNNSVNMTGDLYFQKLYAMLVDVFKLKEWKSSIDEKLSITNEMYMVRKNRLDTVRAETLELIIIVLIAVEISMAFFK